MDIQSFITVFKLSAFFLMAVFFGFGIVLLIRLHKLVKITEKLLDFSDWFLLLQKLPKKLFKRKK